MNTPICSSCAKPQRGIVEFRWSEGAVVYECNHCGAFNEVSEVPRLAIKRPSHRLLHLRVSSERELSPFGPAMPRNPSRDPGHAAR